MVKRVFLVIVLSLNVLLGFSQKSNFGGGLFFGNTFSGMSADNIPGYWKAGITTGLFGHIKPVTIFISPLSFELISCCI